jgi:tagatose 6-phosphate kinase
MILVVCANPAIDRLISIEHLRAGETHRVIEEKRYAGGKGVHVALALAELGQEVCLLGFWGGPSGAWIQAQCEQLGVVCHGPKIDGWNRDCITYKSKDEFNESEFLGAGPNIHAAEAAQFRSEFAALAVGTQAIAICGSHPSSLGIDFYAELVSLAETASSPVFLDCSGESFVTALKKRPYAFHLNQAEARELILLESSDDERRHLAEEFQGYAPLSALTFGREGLSLSVQGKTVQARVEVPLVRSAVGSGDCLLAGLLAAHARGYDLAQSARLAVACGAANCLRPELGMLFKRDVEQLMPQVKLTMQEGEYGKTI